MNNPNNDLKEGVQKFLNALIIAVAVFVALLVLLMSAHGQQRITEDDPRWDCRTMGNKICGKTLTIQRHGDHYDATASDGAKLVEFATLKQAREYAKQHGYTVIDSRPRCGAPTKAGGTCKRVVTKAGVRCWQHRDKR